jgi:hypothetical protein
MAMITLIRLFLAIVASLFKPRARLEAENTELRQQLIVLHRKLPGRVMLSNGDRTFFVWALPSVSIGLPSPGPCSPRDPRALAPRGISMVLALEVSVPLGSPAGRCRIA